MLKAIEKNARLLAIFAVVCTGLVGTVNLLTKDRIVIQEQQQLLTTLSGIISSERHNNDIYLDCIVVNNDELTDNSQKAYLARLNDTPVAAAITTTAPDGYSGNIELLVAINYDGSVSGERTIKHQETPGLGDKIELTKSDWILSFTNKKIINDSDTRWAVAKDGGMFDQFTGATITPRAVVGAVENTVKYFNKNKQQLFASTANCQEPK
jgi:electron transport complex protein RnfG